MTVDELKKKIETLKTSIESDLKALNFDDLKIKYSSKNSDLQNLLKVISEIAVEEKKEAGIILNDIKSYIEQQLQLKSENIQNTTKTFDFDYSLAGIDPNIGNLHPTTQTIREINDFFKHYGFSVAIGPEIETDEYNFEK